MELKQGEMQLHAPYHYSQHVASKSTKLGLIMQYLLMILQVHVCKIMCAQLPFCLHNLHNTTNTSTT